MACALKVAVRLRPPQPHDGKLSGDVLRCCDEVTLEAEGHTFAYDRVFGPAGHVKALKAVGFKASRLIGAMVIAIGWDGERMSIWLEIPFRHDVDRKRVSRRSTALARQTWWMPSSRVPTLAP